MSPPSSGSKNKQSKKPAALSLPPAFTPDSCFAYFSTLKMEEACFSETIVDFQQTSRCYMPENRTHQNICYWQMDILSYRA
jgi:hypothetical protein